MMKRIVFVFVLLALVAGSSSFGATTAKDKAANRTTTKVCVCHVENKNETTGHVIEIDRKSLQAHVNHGDVQCTDCTNVGQACDTANGASCSEQAQTQTQTQTQPEDQNL
jgi:hypothetical protein